MSLAGASFARSTRLSVFPGHSLLREAWGQDFRPPPLAACRKARFEEGDLAAGPLAEFLVQEASFFHSFCFAPSTGAVSLASVKKVPDMRSCQVRLSLSTKAQKKPIMKAESETK